MPLAIISALGTVMLPKVSNIIAKGENKEAEKYIEKSINFVMFLSFANVIRTQYLIPNENDKTYIISVSLGAITNLILNYIFIPKYGSIGACIGTIAAEAMVMIYQTYSVRKKINVSLYLKEIIPFFIKSCIMFVFVYLLNLISIKPFIRIIIQITVGCSIYGILNFKYIISIIDIRKIKKKLFG